MNEQNLIIAALLCAVFLVSACSSDKAPKPTVWGRYQEPAKPAELPSDSGIDEISVVWQRNFGGESLSRYGLLAPAFDSRHVVVANPNGNVAKVELTSGSTVWETELGSQISFGVGLGGNIAVVGHAKGEVTALDLDNGEVVWTATVKNTISAVPAASPAAVVIRTSDGRLIGLNPANGEQRWLVETERSGLTIQGESQPVLDGEIMIIGLGNGKMLVGNSVTGRLGWDVDIGIIGGRNEIDSINDVDSPPILSGSIAYAAAYRGFVKSIDLNSGEVLWQTRYSTRLPMALGRENLYVVSDIGELAALDVDNGELVWHQKFFRGHGMSPPVIVDRRVLIGDSQGRLHSLEPLSGQLLDTQNIFSGAVLSIVENGQSAAVFTSENELALIDIKF